MFAYVCIRVHERMLTEKVRIIVSILIPKQNWATKTCMYSCSMYALHVACLGGMRVCMNVCRIRMVRVV